MCDGELNDDIVLVLSSAKQLMFGSFFSVDKLVCSAILLLSLLPLLSAVITGVFDKCKVCDVRQLDSLEFCNHEHTARNISISDAQKLSRDSKRSTDD